MESYLKALAARLSDVDTTQPLPTSQALIPVQEGDHLVGVCSDEAKRLYCLATSIGNRADRSRRRALVIVIEQIDNPQGLEDAAQVGREVNPLVHELETLTALFWQTIRHTYPDLETKAVLGVREGWQVVWRDADVEPTGSLLDLLARFADR